MKQARASWLLAILACLASGAAGAADITVLCSMSLRGVVEDLRPPFEAQTGDRIVVAYDTSAALKARIEAGAPFDVAILTPPLITALVQQGRVANGTAAGLARAGVGLAARKGAARPDIGSVEAFRRALLDAGSVVYTTAGVSGPVFATALQKLGITEAVMAKARTIPNGLAGEVVARGEADLAVQLIPELMAVPGIEVLGPFPPELQSYIVLTGSISAAAADTARAAAFIAFLRTPDAAAVIRRQGMEPG